MAVKIGITSGWEPGTLVEGWPLVYANKHLVEAIEKAGAIPVILPIVEQVEMYEEYVKMIDGMIVSGEVLSIKKNVFETISDNVLENSNPLRYKNEKAAIRAALKQSIPLLGICRGHQVLAVEAGGSMKEGDITIENDVIHQQGGIAPPDEGIHEVTVLPGSKLSKLLSCGTVRVNSFHRQAVHGLPEGFIVSAISPDGQIEAIEAEDGRWIMGLQFHPETLRNKIWDCLFSEFIRVSGTTCKR